MDNQVESDSGYTAFCGEFCPDLEEIIGNNAPADPQFIETVPEVGYHYIALVSN